MRRVILLIAILAGAASAALAAADEPVGDNAGKAAPPKVPAWLARGNPFAPLPEELKAVEPVAPAAVATDRSTAPGEAQGSNDPSRKAPAAAAPEPPPVILKLNGILFAKGMPVALVNDSILATGDLIEGYLITFIGEDLVTAEKGGARFLMTTRQPVALRCVISKPEPAGAPSEKTAPAAEAGAAQAEEAEAAQAAQARADEVSDAAAGAPDAPVKTEAPAAAEAEAQAEPAAPATPDRNLDESATANPKPEITMKAERPDPYATIVLPTPLFLAMPMSGKGKP